MSSWWRKIAEELGVEGKGSGSWAKAVAQHLGVESKGASHPRRIAADYAKRAEMGSWARILTPEDATEKGQSWPRILALNGGVSGLVLQLTPQSAPENTEIDTVIATAFVSAWGADAWKLFIDADPDSKFSVNEDDHELVLADEFNYEVKTSHLVTLRGQNQVTFEEVTRTFNFQVIDVRVKPSTITDLSTSVLDSTSIGLIFTPAEHADSYEYRFRVTGDTEWSTSDELVDELVSGLSPSTSYQFQVRGVSDDPEAVDADWSNIAVGTTTSASGYVATYHYLGF